MTGLEAPAALRIGRPGAGLAVHTFGDGIPVLAVHGFASNARANWVDAGWARALTAEGCQLIAPDLRGHGGSDKPHEASAYRMPLLVDDLVAVLDELEVDAADVVGYSLGARLSIELALAAPARVRSLTLGGAGLGAPFEAFDVDGARRSLADGTGPADAATAGFLAMARAVPGNDLEALVALIEGLQGEPTVTDLPDLPLAVVNGDRDDVAVDGPELAARAPQGRFVALPARTHANAVSARAFKRTALEQIAR